MESYEEGNEDERGKMRKVIRKGEDSYYEEKKYCKMLREIRIIGWKHRGK